MRGSLYAYAPSEGVPVAAGPTMRVDPYSETWQAVAAALDIKITLALRPLETPGTSPTETEFLRGRLSLARELLKLAEPRPEIQVASPVDY